MDCFDIKVEKANAILRYKRLQKVTTLFRFMEVCIFLFIVTRISTHLPLAFKVSGDCIRGLSVTIFSPGFLFILGNAIVVVLFLKSGQLSAQETKSFSPAIEFCNEYVEGCENKIRTNQVDGVKKPRRKQVKKQVNGAKEETVLDMCSFEDRTIHRSHSENFMRYQPQDSCRKLRRTVTENGRKSEKYSERSDDAVIKKTPEHKTLLQNLSPRCYAEDDMSGEEFRHAVEAFIARQQRSLREEFSSIVTYGT
ncbi:Testis-and ovary-specific PAZ domain-containing protein 1 [Heracleum sosnowskyi]|uniref:Testis-and ovary-specific PAZ domain-containing protein 1 n=1 Tax=Heracleum sosnowskyi TaxID=360622 RepID=A0AAD8GQ82_9APIA|nr:Testis-and ovary-specific PAZ domain-containing protein 1 [Heracleum sosnowskyi]